MPKTGILFKYKDFLPVTPQTPLFTMGEGDTPLIRCDRLAREVGCGELYLKFEGCNPTGSFKDRGMVVAVAKALEAGSKAIICASTGNTSASAAAYAAYCGLTAIIIVPEDKIATGKMAQAIIYGAKIITITGNFDQALEIVRTLAEKHSITLVNSLNPHRIEGQKTAAFELVEILGDAPDYLFIPVGNAGNITAYWKGFVESYQTGRSKQKPVIMGFQAEGAAPIVRGYPIAKPETVASAIRIGKPASWQPAVATRDESGGIIDLVSDAEILAAQKLMATRAGVFSELASAASIAGLLKLSRQGMDFSRKRTVCVITGTGLKDTDTVLKDALPCSALPAEIKAVEKALSWG